MTGRKKSPTETTIKLNISTQQAMFALREPAIRAAIEWLQLPAGSRGLDAGCGIGRVTGLLAEAVQPDGRVTGLDISPQFIAHAGQVGGARAGKTVVFREGDVTDLPFDDGYFDWAWSMDTLWPGPEEMGCPSDDPVAMTTELARVVRPGGRVAILFWSSHTLLPGYPLLESRLNTSARAAAPFSSEMAPRQHALMGLAWLRELGLAEIGARTFVADVHAPLREDVRAGLAITLPMFWGDAEKILSPEDLALFNRLSRPDSPEFIVNHPDYYAFVTYSLFYGRIPDRR